MPISGYRTTRASRKNGKKAATRKALLKGVVTMGERYPNAGPRAEAKLPANSIRTVKNMQIALGVARMGGSVQAAADELEVSRKSFRQWMAEDDEFRELWEDAVEGGTDGLEDEVIRRGARGVRKGIWHNGKRVGYERLYSDTLLTAALAARRKSKWGKNDGVNVQVNNVNAHVHMSLEDLRKEAENRGLPVRIFEK